MVEEKNAGPHEVPSCAGSHVVCAAAGQAPLRSTTVVTTTKMQTTVTAKFFIGFVMWKGKKQRRGIMDLCFVCFADA